MKILLQDRLDSNRYPGGDTTQIRKISEFLYRHGVRNLISQELDPDLDDFDLVLLFNLNNLYECFLKSLNAIRQGKPYILFPIYWDLSRAIPREAFAGTRAAFMEGLPLFSREWIRRVYAFRKFSRLIERRGDLFPLLFNHSKRLREKVLARSEKIIPNSEAEKRLLMDQFPKVSKEKYAIIRNGCEKILGPRPPDNWPAGIEDKAFICCLGGVGPRKNQLNLVRAMKGFNLPLVLMGPLMPENEGYYKRLKREDRSRVFFIGPHPPQAAAWVLRQARVHAQPSYIETPGLASLEAGLYGCNVVAADVPPVREYFGDRIYYCDPNDVGSIRKAVESASMASIPNEVLSKFIEEEYSWDRTLQPLMEVIDRVASSRGRN